MGAKMKRAKLIWRDLGPIKANTALDNVPKQSGVYKLTFHLWGNAYAYIGEAGARGLRARIRDYANSPTQGNKIEHLLYDLLKEAGEAELSVCCIVMDEQKARRQFEKEEIAKAVRQGLMYINKAGCRDDLPMQRFALQSETRMLLRDLVRVCARLVELDEAGSNRGINSH
jgi:Uri superfamily endonuclease